MRSLALSISLLAGAALAGSVQLPYQGRLDKGGKPQNGSYNLQFSLYDAAASGTLLWQDTYTGVAVVQGAFSVKLGSNVALPAATFSKPAVFIAIAVEGPGETVFTSLGGRQQVLTAPYATQTQQDFYVPQQLNVGAPGLDAGVTIFGAPSNGTTAPLQIVSGTTHLAVDGQALDSIGTLQLQTKTGNGTVVGGSLAVGGSLTAPNVWTKIYDSGGEVVLGSAAFSIHPNTARQYVVYVDGWLSNSTSGDSHLLLRFNGANSGYRSFLTWNGETASYFFESTGVAIAFNPESAGDYYNSQAYISSRGGNPYAFTVQATSSAINPGNGHVFYNQSGGGIVETCSDPCQVTVEATVANIWRAHVVVYAIPN